MRAPFGDASAGCRGELGYNAIRFLPPPIATADDLAKSVEIFRAVLAAKA